MTRDTGEAAAARRPRLLLRAVLLGGIPAVGRPSCRSGCGPFPGAHAADQAAAITATTSATARSASPETASRSPDSESWTKAVAPRRTPQ